MSRRFTGAYAAIARALVAGDAKARLARHGYVVLDDAFDGARARALKDEFNALRRRGAFVANASLFAREGVVALAKPHVYECEVHRLSKEDAASAPLVNELANEASVMEALNEAFGALGGGALDRTSTKLQVNEGAGGCFPLHFDSDASLDSRRVTMCAYLDEDWCEARDGGALALYPFPRGRVTIAPKAGRVVIFSSEFGLHRVMPAMRERFMFTVWYFAKEMRAPMKAKPPGVTAEAQMTALLDPALRKHLGKIVLADEWAKSIREAHGESEGVEAALKTHWDEVALISRVLSNNYPLGLELIAKEMERGDGAFDAGVDWFPE